MTREVQDLIHKLNEYYWEVEEDWHVDHVNLYSMQETCTPPHLHGPFYTLILKEVSEDKFKSVAEWLLKEKTLKEENKKLRDALNNAMDIIKDTRRLLCITKK